MVNSEQEAQQAALPVMFLLIGTFIFVQPILLEPTGTLAVVLSWLPFSSPIIDSFIRLRQTRSFLTGNPMRLVCLHADTIDALKRLNIRLDDLTPQGLWSSEYHLIGLTPDQLDALAIFRIEAEDITPAQLVSMAGERHQTGP